MTELERRILGVLLAASYTPDALSVKLGENAPVIAQALTDLERQGLVIHISWQMKGGDQPTYGDATDPLYMITAVGREQYNPQD